MHRIEIKLNDRDFEDFQNLVKEYGFKKKTDFLRFMIRNHKFSELMETLKYFMRHNHSSEMNMKKMLYLNFKSLTYMLSLFLGEEPYNNLKVSRTGVENAKTFLKEKETEFYAFMEMEKEQGRNFL